MVVTHLWKHRMCQQATVVNQPPFPLVSNTADNALDGFDVSGVQSPTFWVKRNRQHPTSIGENSMNLPNNCKTNNLRLLCFKFPAFRNGDNNNVSKLPEEHLKLKLFRTVLMVLVSINKLLILLGKRLVSKKHLKIVHTHGRKMHLGCPCVWQQYHARAWCPHLQGNIVYPTAQQPPEEISWRPLAGQRTRSPSHSWGLCE